MASTSENQWQKTQPVAPTERSPTKQVGVTDNRCSESSLEYLVTEAIRYYDTTTNDEHDGVPMNVSLASIGTHVGTVLAERLTVDRPPVTDILDVMKWICKDLWSALFLKNIDNLRTNHKGTFVLRDTQFRWTKRLAQNLVAGGERATNVDLAEPFLILPCGIIKGAISAFGFDAAVSADARALPQCDFTVVLNS